MGKADVSSKWLLGEDPDAWVRWMMADPTLKIEAFLSAEFQHVLRRSDVLLRVQDGDGPFLLLVELQLHYDPDMPWRMQAYAALAEEKYRLPAFPLVFYLLPPSPGVELPEQYYREFRGLITRRDFRVARAWELDAQEVLARGPLALVPLTPLMKGADEEVLRTGVKVLREREAGEEMEAVLALFASFVMSPEQIRQIVRWEMTVLRESPWYQEIVQEGVQQGVRKAVLHLLQSRFELSDETVKHLTSQLEQVHDEETLHRLLVTAANAERLDQFQTGLGQAIRLTNDGADLED